MYVYQSYVQKKTSIKTNNMNVIQNEMFRSENGTSIQYYYFFFFSVHNNKLAYNDQANVETPFCYNATVMYFVSESLYLMCYLSKYTCSQQQGHFEISQTPPN